MSESLLARPLTLPGGAVLRNRLAKSAMSEQLSSRDGGPTPALSRLYGAWAAGGAGLLVTGNVMVDPTALEGPRNVILEDDRHLDALSAWAAAATAGGTHTWMQINHPGRQALKTLSPEPVAPSAVPVEFGGNLFGAPRALTEPEITRLIGRYATTAGLARRAGFTGVQIHAAHGYLISQFLSPRANLRTDDWGGTPERRMRFLLEVVRAVRAEVGPAFPVGVKLNSADFQRGGFTEDESMAVVEALAAEGLDLLEISGGTYESAAMVGNTDAQREAGLNVREAYFLAYARQVRQRVAIPLMLTGGFRSLAMMTEALSEGAIDVVGLARPLAVEPDLPARLLAGQDPLHPLPPIRTGIKQVDGILEVYWYTRQLHRLAHGRPPEPRLGPWAAFGEALWMSTWDTITRRR